MFSLEGFPLMNPKTTEFCYRSDLPNTRSPNDIPSELLDVVRAWSLLPINVKNVINALVELRKGYVGPNELEPFPRMSVSNIEAFLNKLEVITHDLLRVLRHAPEEASISMDFNGWVDAEDVLRWLEKRLPSARDVGLYRLVERLGDRFQIKDQKIRASYGHSSENYQPTSFAVPTEPLFHGTGANQWSLIEAFGLVSGRRRFAQLTTNFEYAQKIARSHADEPIVLQVTCRGAINAGVQFLETGTHVWLSPNVPAQFLQPWHVAEDLKNTTKDLWDLDLPHSILTR